MLHIRATLHMRLRACDHYTSSTLIGGKGKAGPSLLHSTLEGPMEYVNARWMSSLHGFLYGINWIMSHGYWILFKNYLLEVGLTQKHETMPLSQFLIYSILSYVRALHELKFIETIFWLRTHSHMTSHCT